jgi:hypothetical protein
MPAQITRADPEPAIIDFRGRGLELTFDRALIRLGKMTAGTRISALCASPESPY